MVIIKLLFKLSKTGFSVIGIVWTLAQIFEKYLSHIPVVSKYVDNILTLVIPAVIAILIELIYIKWKKNRIRCKFDDITIVVKPGNILNIKKGVNVVGINNQLNTTKSKIAKGSIHYQMVEEFGEDKMIKIFKNGKKYIESGKKYFKDEVAGRDFLFLPMSNTDDSGAAQTSTSIVKSALKDLFFNQDYLNIPNKTMNMPIIGTGAAGLKPSKQDVIKLILDSFFDFQKSTNDKSSKIKTLNIIVYRKDIIEIDWIELRQWIENQINYCRVCEKEYLVELSRSPH